MSLSVLKREEKKKYIYYKWSKNGEVLEKSLKKKDIVPENIITKEDINEKKNRTKQRYKWFFRLSFI